MRQTPRSKAALTPRGRGIGTLIGNGWLRESPSSALAKWEMRGNKSALRKCMFMPVPEQLRALFPPDRVSSAVPPPVYRPARAEEMVPHRRDARKDAREFPICVPGAVDPRAAAQQAHAIHVQYAQKVAAAAAAGKTPATGAWWEDPIALGSLLILVPPIGLAAVWGSKRYSSDARWALTVMTALTMCLMSAIVIAALAMR